MAQSLHSGLNRANENWHDHFIMAWDGYIDRPTNFVGNRKVKPLDQMGRACNSSKAAWNRQDDDEFSPWIESMKGISTTFQVDFEIWVLPFLYDMNYSVIISRGVLFQCFRAVSLLWLSRISLELTLDSSLLEFSYAPFLSHLARSFLAWIRLAIAFPPSKYGPFVFSSTCAWSALPCLLQNYLLLSFMDNRQKSRKEPRAMNSQDFFAGQDQQEPEKDCARCQRLRIHMGEISSTFTFELETLSQHRHLIERLQDEVFTKRSQIEDQRSQMENMQGRLDQMERNYQQPNTQNNTQKASRNLTSATMNQVLDLNEPAIDPIWEQHGHLKVKKKPGS
jgi:hypothetical protein